MHASPFLVTLYTFFYNLAHSFLFLRALMSGFDDFPVSSPMRGAPDAICGSRCR